MRKLKILYWLTMTGGLISLFSAFSYSPLQQNRIKEMALKAKDSTQEFVAGKAKSEEPKFVQINGKFYPFNPSHTYLVNGEKIYFRNDSAWYDSNGKKIVKNEVVEVASENVANPAPPDLTNMNPLKMYTREGMQALMQNLQKAQDDLRQHQKTLEAIDSEIK